MVDGEQVVAVINPGDYKKHLLLFFENGKAARVGLDSYETKTNRKRLVNAYSDNSPLVSVLMLDDEAEVVVFSTDGRTLVFNTVLLTLKSSRSSQGVNVLLVKSKYKLKSARFISETSIINVSRYRVRSIPAAGALLREEDREEKQLSFVGEE
jgi:DNA gyrase subunit A